MQISKNSWHYRFNSQIQGYSFRDRAAGRKFTTCTYIRTTLRSLSQGIAYTVLGALFAGLVLLYLYCMVQVPVAWLFGFEIMKGALVPCFIGWAGVAMFSLWALVLYIHDLVRPGLNARHERKLSLLEQRIKDGREGICTIVEVV